MQTIHVHTTVPYEVQIGNGLLCSAGEILSAICTAKRVMLVSDDTVFSLYGAQLEVSLQGAGFLCHRFVFPNGEAQKRLSTVEALLEAMAAEHFDRGDLVVALGGGVVGDLAGFSAAVYARGIDYIQIPTTLLAAVDASVGGKTAVDLSHGKNLCGAFHQPRLVLCDTDTLQTLHPLQIGDGLAEMLKYGILCDAGLFAQIQNYQNENMELLIARCVEIKRDIVSADETDRGKRMLLNLGHTVGHAIEVASSFSITHGHGVAIGLAVVARAAEKMGVAKRGTAAEIVAALKVCGLPHTTDYPPALLAAHALSDKKADGDTIRLILPHSIGDARIHRIPLSALEDWILAGIDA